MPVHLLQPNGRQLLEHHGSVIARGRGSASARGGWLEAGGGGAGFEGRRGGQGRCAGGCARVLEDAKIDRLLVGLYAPGDCVSSRDIDPAD